MPASAVMGGETPFPRGMYGSYLIAEGLHSSLPGQHA